MLGEARWQRKFEREGHFTGVAGSAPGTWRGQLPDDPTRRQTESLPNNKPSACGDISYMLDRNLGPPKTDNSVAQWEISSENIFDRTFDFSEVAGRNMRIYFSGFAAFVPKQCLDISQIHTSF